MKPLGLIVAFAGYTLAYFGWCSLRGPGVGLVDLVVPGREIAIPGSPVKVGEKARAGSSAKAPLLNIDAMNKLTPAQRRRLPKNVQDFMNSIEPGYV